jgi:YidC/Oxa1 family membrane protein insertase
MEKRVFLAIFLCFVVLVIYQAYFVPPPPPRRPPETPAPQVVAPDVDQTTRPADPAVAPTEAAPPSARPLVADAAVRDIVVDTDLVRAVFTSAGGTLKSWKLKNYLDAGGQPVELVPSFPNAIRPFTMATTDAALSATLRNALFQPSADQLALGAAPGTLTFLYRDESGLNARKTFHFQPEQKFYIVNVSADLDVNGVAHPVTLDWGPAIRLGYGLESEVGPRAIFYRDDAAERLTADAMNPPPRVEGELRFAGVDDHYFLSAVLPGTPRVAVVYQPHTDTVQVAGEAQPRAFISYSVSTPGAAALTYFMGPKDFDVLRAVDPPLVFAIDFGIFRWLVVPLLQALKWIYGYLGNYGWSIIVLTVLINLAIFPLRHRSMVSMRKMQALQPEMKALQERYAKYKITDPERQKMNQEMMALYKQRGVNPASGCVPMLLTFPILFAFYAMLSAAIELRGAPFFGWIRDLSAADPYYIWPVIMGGTMFWQQKITPTTVDPTQARIFMMMPIVFTFMFLWFPSGLVIYWLASNLMAIGQQYVTNRIIGPPPAPPKAVTPAGPPAKRGRKGADAGKP